MEPAANNSMERGEIQQVQRSPTGERLSSIVLEDLNSQRSKSPENVDLEEGNHAISWMQAIAQLFKCFKRNLPRTENEFSAPEWIVRKIIDQPDGYPRLAALLDSDENFMLYRRFGYLQARLLLHKQDELRECELHLDRMDREDAQNNPDGPRWLRSRALDAVRNTDRQELLARIESKFNEYGTLLKTAQMLLSFQRPTRRNYANVKSYFDNQDPISSVERYIYRKEDLISLKIGREKAWLYWCYDQILMRMTSTEGKTKVLRAIELMLGSRELELKADSMDSLFFLSREKVEIVASLVRTLVITATILALFIVPVYVLLQVNRKAAAGDDASAIKNIINVLIVSTFIFSGVLSMFTGARRHEIFGAVAAYCAVLVVFIGNVGQLAGKISKG